MPFTSTKYFSLLFTLKISFLAVQNAILNANRVFNNFVTTTTAIDGGKSAPDLEIFVIGDFVGGLLLFELLTRNAAQQEDGEEPEQQQLRSPMPTVSKSPASARASPYSSFGSRFSNEEVREQP